MTRYLKSFISLLLIVVCLAAGFTDAFTKAVAEAIQEQLVMTEHIELYSEDLKAVNTKDCQRVTPVKKEIAAESAAHRQVTLRKHSWNMMRFSY